MKKFDLCPVPELKHKEHKGFSKVKKAEYNIECYKNISINDKYILTNGQLFYILGNTF